MEQAVQKSKFSGPETEKLFQTMLEVCEGKNLKVKKAVVELIAATQERISCEVQEREKEIELHSEMIAALKSAHDSLNIPPQF